MTTVDDNYTGTRRTRQGGASLPSSGAMILKARRPDGQQRLPGDAFSDRRNPDDAAVMTREVPHLVRRYAPKLALTLPVTSISTTGRRAAAATGAPTAARDRRRPAGPVKTGPVFAHHGDSVRIGELTRRHPLARHTPDRSRLPSAGR